MQPLTDEEKKHRRETWGVYRYQPTFPTKERPFINDQLAFHQSLAKIRVIIGPNRAGKTTPAVHEPAAMVTMGDGGDPPDWWGRPRSLTPRSPLTLWLASPKLPELPIGDARLKRLFIGFWYTDPKTGERMFAPPLIPRSHLKNPECLDQRNVTIIETKNNDIFVLKSSHQKPSSSAGEEPDCILVDEKTDPLVWYEFVARVSQRPDAFIIHVLTDDAENNETDYLNYLKPGVEDGTVEFFRFNHENPHIDTTHHERVLSLLPPEQRRVRRSGERLGEVRQVYPFANEWRRGFVHTGEPYKNQFGGDGNWVPKIHWPKITPAWTRYVIHDPGETNPAACAWIAVEPGLNNLWVYRGLYWPEPYANFIDTVREIFEATGEERIRAFFMDPKYGKRKMQFGFDAPKDRRRIDLYNAESSKLLGRRFRWAMAPPSIERMWRPTRSSYLKAYLDPRTQAPMMWFLDDGSPGMEALKTEFTLYRWAASPKGRTSNPDVAVKKHDNFIYCIEVAASMGLQWYPPDGEELSVLRSKRDMADPDGKLAEFMEGGYVHGFNELEFL